MLIRLSILLSFYLSVAAFAPEVLKVGGKKKFVVISHGEKGDWGVDDTACLYRGALEVGCGRIVRTTERAAVLKLVFQKDLPLRGDEVKRTGRKKLQQAEVLEQNPGPQFNPTGDPQTPVPLMAEGPNLQAPPLMSPEPMVAPPAPTVSKKLASRKIKNKKKKIRKRVKRKRYPRRRRSRKREIARTRSYARQRRAPERFGVFGMNLTAGASIGSNHLFPQLHLQYAVADNWAVGLVPFMFGNSVNQTSVKGFGAYLTGNFYSQAAYRGLWAQVGLGIVNFSATLGSTQQEDSSVFSGLATIGWRQRWDLGINVGAAVGAQYVVDPKLQLVVINYRDIQPTIVIDFGLNF